MRAKISLSIVSAALVAVFGGLTQAEPASPDSIVRVGACATLGWTWGVFVQGDYAYVADRSYLTVVDVSLPSAPWVTGSLSDIDVHPIGVFVIDTVAYHNNGVNATFSTASVADPATPYKLGWCFRANPTTEPKGIHVLDTLTYLANADKGLFFIDTADPGLPTVIDSFNTPGTALDLFVKDTLSYIADQDSLQIVSVADPTSAFRAGAVGMPNYCYDVFVVDTFAYVACQSNFGTDGTVQIVNVSDPMAPLIVSSVAMNGDPLAVYVSGDYAYVAAADWWSSEKGPRRVGGLRPAWTARMPADVEGGLRIVDVLDPTSPVLVASYDTPGDPRDVFVRDTLVFIADYDSLQILRHVIVGIEETKGKPQDTSLWLEQNQPNPFSEITIIRYTLPNQGRVSITIYDANGRLVRTLVDEEQRAGSHFVRWDRRDDLDDEVNSGVYFYRLTTGSITLTKKMTLVQ